MTKWKSTKEQTTIYKTKAPGILHLFPILRRAWRYRMAIGIRKSDKMGVECCDKMTKEWTTKYYTEDGATRTLLKTGGELRCSEKYSVPSPDMSPVLLLLFKIRRSHESRQRDGVLTTSKAHFSRLSSNSSYLLRCTTLYTCAPVCPERIKYVTYSQIFRMPT
jgi:hypothetical protein